jgi:hypothetical protein
VTAAAFKGTALFVWSRHRALVVAALAVHVAAFLFYDYLWAEQRTVAVFLNTYLRAAPLFLPLLLFTSAVNVATADLGGGESWYPRQLFTLPLTTRGLALPFMTYTVGLYAMLWAAAAFITDGKTPTGPADQARTERLQPWEPFLDLALLAWLQAAIWWPFSIRWARIVLLFVVVAVYFGAFIVSAQAGLSATVLTVFCASLAALAHLAGFHGIARARTGEASSMPRTRAARRRPSDTRSFPSTLHAQRWFERHVQRGRGTVVAAFIVAFVLLTGALLFLFGTFAISDPRPLAMQAATLFFWTLLIVGCATGPAFAAFNVRAAFADGNAFRMPSFFAALPMTTGDFAWAKLATAARRMALLAVYLLAASASLLGLAAWGISAEPWAASAPWQAGFAGVVERHGALEVTVLAAGGVSAFLALSGAATANLVWVGLFGRGWRIASSVLTIVVAGVILAAPWLAANPAALVRVNAALPTAFAALAILKLAALALLAYVVGARRLYPWVRLGGIALAWTGAVGVCSLVVLRYAPEGLIETRTLLAALVVLLPVLGLVAAPLALQVNRCR